MTKNLSKIVMLALILAVGPLTAQARKCVAKDYCSAEGKLSARYEKIIRMSIPMVVHTFGETIFNGHKGDCAGVSTSASQSMSNCPTFRANATNMFLGLEFFQTLWKAAQKIDSAPTCGINPHAFTDVILAVYDSNVYATFDAYTGQRREFTYGEFSNLMVRYMGVRLCR